MQNNNNMCRFCLKLIPDANMRLINRVTMKMLAVLLIKLDLDVSEDPLVCKICLGVLDEIYTFKSKCLHSEDVINTNFESKLKVTLRDIMKLENERDANIAEDVTVCRLCIKIPLNGSYIALNKKTGTEASLCRDMIQMQLPEINLSITEEPIICDACRVLLKNYFDFASSCKDVEQKINMYCDFQGSDDKGGVDLLCVLQFTENKAMDCENNLNLDLVIKQEESPKHVKVENVEEVEKGTLSRDHFTAGSSADFYIKNEEVDIKAEDYQMRCDQHACTANVEEFRLSQNEHHVRCPKATGCITKNRSSLSLNEKTRDPTKHKVKCEQCEYSTDRPSRLRLHLVTHMELGETTVYYCATCDFKTKYKCSLRCHVRRCAKKETKSRFMFQCKHCDYRTVSNSSLYLHKSRHDPSKRKFKCEQCEYSTYCRSSLTQHLLIHMELGESTVYSCVTCDFKTKYKGSLKDHSRWCAKKDDADSRVLLECDRCTFQTKWRSSLNNHKKTHDPTKRAFKCQQCEYSTSQQSWLKQHLLSHMELGATVVYYCAMCKFKTKYKNSLTFHVKNCSRKKLKDDN